jgi:hypothetical protein
MILSTLDKCPIINQDTREALIYSDAIVVPARNCPIGQTLSFELSQNIVTKTMGYKKKVVGICYGGNPFTHEVVYVPLWMYNLFTEKKVDIAPIELPLAKTIRIQPYNTDILLYGYPKLQKAFEQYNSLTRETLIPIKLDDKVVYVGITTVNEKQSSAKIRGSSVYFEFLPVITKTLPWIGVGRRICD